MRLTLTVFFVVAAAAMGLSAAAAQTSKRIVLSYDDAPMVDGELYSGEERTERLIERLDAVGTGPVVFFVATQGIVTQQTGRERLMAYAEAGHLLANHTHTHMWAHRTEVGEYLTDIDIAAGHLEGLPNTRPWFRFPYLDEGRRTEHIGALAEGLQARGLSNGYVTVDTYDWHLEMRVQQALSSGRTVDFDRLGALYIRLSLEAAEFYDTIAREDLGYSPVHVLLLHENDLAARYAGELVEAFREAGWDIVHPDDAYTDPLPVPATRLTGQGRVAALAIDAGRDNRTIVHWGIEADSIDAEIKAMGIFSE